MTFQDLALIIVFILLLSPFIIVMAYAIGRSYALGHFRTKLEYWRSMVRESEHNGDSQ